MRVSVCFLTSGKNLSRFAFEGYQDAFLTFYLPPSTLHFKTKKNKKKKFKSTFEKKRRMLYQSLQPKDILLNKYSALDFRALGLTKLTFINLHFFQSLVMESSLCLRPHAEIKEERQGRKNSGGETSFLCFTTWEGTEIREGSFASEEIRDPLPGSYYSCLEFRIPSAQKFLFVFLPQDEGHVSETAEMP